MLVRVDAAYVGRLVTWAAAVLRLTVQIIKRSTDVAGFVAQPRRWVAERTLAWLFTHRRPVGERLPATHETMVYLAMIMLMSTRLAHTQNY